MKSTLACFCI